MRDTHLRAKHRRRDHAASRSGVRVENQVTRAHLRAVACGMRELSDKARVRGGLYRGDKCTQVDVKSISRQLVKVWILTVRAGGWVGFVRRLAWFHTAVGLVSYGGCQTSRPGHDRFRRVVHTLHACILCPCEHSPPFPHTPCPYLPSETPFPCPSMSDRCTRADSACTALSVRGHSVRPGCTSAGTCCRAGNTLE
jgi:hypothetical protein